ncbi:MAG: 30S ribosomal protein S5 [Nanoarchaeota archaeon]
MKKENKKEDVEKKEEKVEEVEVIQEETVIVDAPPEVVPEIVEKEETKVEQKEDISAWNPKTTIGKKVKNKEITEISELLDKGIAILESQIVDALLPDLQQELLMIGQSKGKFGGGSKRIFRQTQKKTPEGNKPSFGCFAVVGSEKGYVGGSLGKSKDTVPAREKSIRKAKLKIFKIKKGCGSWQCGCKEPHSIPFTVEGKCGSVEIKLMPAPKGKGLCIEPECGKVLKLAGIKDVWSKSKGQTRNKLNMVMACLSALRKLNEMK